VFSLYRRHEADCRFHAKGVRHIKCDCPVWMDGFDDKGKRQRRTLKTRSWSQAQARLTDFESGRVEIPEPEKAPRLDSAIAAFLDDCRARKLEPSTIVSYTNTLGHLARFFPDCNLARVNLEALTKFRSSRVALDPDGTRR
jgi:hypothetical protein